MSERKLVAVIGVVIIIAAIAILFVNKGKHTGGEIVLPVVADLTGPIALYGQWAVDGMKMAIEDINTKGGIMGHLVKLVIEDGQSKPQAAVNAFQKTLTTFKPGVIIMATNTSSTMACAPIANNKKVVLFTPIASGPNITQAGDFVFRNRVSGFYEADTMATIAAEQLGLKRVALVVINNEAGPGYIEAFQKAFENRGGYITQKMLIEPGETDYRTPATRVKVSKAEAVFLALTVKEAALFIRQSAEIGFRPKWLSMTTIMSDDLFKIAGKHAEGLIFVAESGDESDPNYKQFAQRFEDKYGYIPPMNSINGYDAIRLLGVLVANHGNIGVKIRDGLYATKSYEGVGGKLSFDENGDANKPLLLCTVRNGKFVSYK